MALFFSSPPILGGVVAGRGGGGKGRLIYQTNHPQPLLNQGGELLLQEHFEKMKKVHNVKGMKTARKELRNNLTPAEAKLWSILKDSQVAGRKFRRQHSVGPYVLDFFCPSEKLCIELDGCGHFTEGGYKYDMARTEYLNALNIRVIRFENRDVFENTEGVLEEIRRRFI